MAVLLILAVAAWIFRYGPWLFFSDSATYIQGAQGIAEGNGYRMVAYEHEPPIGLYPPLHSALLSVIWRINPHFPDNFGLLWGTVALIQLVAAWVFLKLLLRAGVPIWLSALLVLNWGLAPRCLQMSSWLLSDPGFILVVFGLLWWLAPSDPWPWPARRWWGVAAFLVPAFFLRSSALGLIGGLGLISLIELRRKKLHPVVAMTASFAACVLLKKLQPAQQGPDYGSVIHDEFVQLGGIAGYLKVVFHHAWDAISGAPLWEQFSFLGYYLAKSAGFHGGKGLQFVIAGGWTVLFWSLLALAGIGWRRQESSWKYGAVVCAFVYVLQPILVPWDSENFGRYLSVLQPLFWIWVWYGTRDLTWVAQRRRSVGIAVAVLLVASATANVAANVVERKHWRNFFSAPELQEVADWTRTNTPPTSRVAIDYRMPAYYFRQWLGRPLVADYFNPNRFESPVSRQAQQGVEADYVVLAEHAYGAYTPPAAFRLVHASPHGDFKIYAVSTAGKSAAP